MFLVSGADNVWCKYIPLIFWPTLTTLQRGLSAIAELLVVAVPSKLENVAIANALQLEAARRRAVPIPSNSSPVPSLKSLSLSDAVL